MKKFLNVFAIALVALFCATACSKDDDESNISDREYVFSAKVSIKSGSATEEEQQEVVDKALRAAGLSADNYNCTLTGRDSVDVRVKLMEKVETVKKAIENAQVTVSGMFVVKGIEKKYLNSDDYKQHPINLWYEEALEEKQQDVDQFAGDVSVEYLCEYGVFFPNKHALKWVKSIKASSKKEEDDYNVPLEYDFNDGAGGDDIYLIFEHYGKKGDGQAINDEYPEKVIADVIAVYGANPPSSMKVGERTYKKFENVYDLNRGAGGSYIWLYYTSEFESGKLPMMLTTGSYNSNGIYAMYNQWWFGNDNFNASDYLDSPIYNMGRYFDTKVVQAFDTTGRHLGEADFNHGAKGRFIKLILSYTVFK